METFLKDFRLAARALRKAPAFTAVSLGVLALGIGANSVMFGVVDTVLLRPLAYRDPHRLMAIETVQQDTNTPISNSPPEFYRLRDESRAFETVAGLYRRPVNLTGAHEPERVRAIVVSADLLSLLGAAPVLGRGFARDDERWGSHRVALIGSSLWRTRFGADPAVIGRTVGLDGQPYTIVGVLPPGFSWLGYEAELLLPMSFEPGDNMNSHNNYFMAIVARLRRGATQEQGRREVSALGSSVAKEFPESRGLGMRAVPMDEWMTGEVRPAILVLLGAVSLVLLIACANVANLFLVRAAARGREIAIRSALGASRGRLLRQLLTESVLLSALGGVLGLVLAFWGTEALNGLDHNVLPRMRDVTIDVRVLAFTAGVSLLTGILFGLVPALQGSATPLRESLTEAAPTMQGGRRRLTAALVVAEVALSLVLLAGAGLLVKSTYRLLRVDLGFDPRDVLTAEIHLPAQKYLDAELARRFSPASTAKAAHFYDDVIARLRSLPGVRAVGAISGVPFGGNFWGKRAVFHDRPLPATSNELPEILYQVVAGDYFGTLKIPVRGRAFDERDRLDSQPVAIVSEELVRRYWKGEDPLGKTLATNAPRELNPVDTLPPDYKPMDFTVIGVAGDVHYAGLDRHPMPIVYVPYAQGAEGQLTMAVLLRAKGDPLALAAPLREELRSVDPDQALANVSTLESRVSRAIAQPRLHTWLLGVFAAIAVLLAAIGMYGVMAVAVVQRTREIGIRMALGAVRRDVLSLVVRQGFSLAAAGLSVGLLGALALTRLMRALLFSVGPSDPTVFGAITALLAAIALAACYLPARRAARVDPMVALRYE